MAVLRGARIDAHTTDRIELAGVRCAVSATLARLMLRVVMGAAGRVFGGAGFVISELRRHGDGS